MTQTQSDDLVTRLLPCPFCDQQPAIETRGKDLIVFRCPESSPCYGSGLAVYGQSSRREEAVCAWNTRPEAAAEIQRLQAQVAVAREALRPFARVLDDRVSVFEPGVTVENYRAARAALASIEGASQLPTTEE